MALWVGLLVHGANGGSYALLDGTLVSGEPGNCDQIGVQLKAADDSYLPRIPWGKFSDEALRQLRNDTKNAQFRTVVEMVMFDDIRTEKGNPPAIVVKQPDLPSRASGHLGVIAIFASPLGWVMLLALYGANLFAAYEVALFRRQPLRNVCGLAAIPFLGVASPIYFLALPTCGVADSETPHSSVGNASYSPPPISNPARTRPAAPVDLDGPEPITNRRPQKPAPVALTKEELPAPVVFQRGDFSFNRRFFETKLAGFFRVVLSEADKDLRIHITAVRGEFEGKRISRITPTELYLQVFKEDATAEEMIPFAEIQEVQVRHKDLQ
jgi:hypothetical protein